MDLQIRQLTYQYIFKQKCTQIGRCAGNLKKKEDKTKITAARKELSLEHNT